MAFRQAGPPLLAFKSWRPLGALPLLAREI